MPTPQIDRRDWSTLSRGEQLRQLEMEGYLILPNVLSPALLAQLRKETAAVRTNPMDYSVHQRTCGHMQWQGGAITQLIDHQPVTGFLQEVLGDDLVFMTYAYAISEPGHPGISLHTDGQPYGSAIFGYEGSCPIIIRVLYYLDELTPEVSPFRVVPRSHLSLHADGNPYKRYAAHPQEVMVPAPAGSALLLNHKVFHGNFPNVGTYARRMLAIAYRPAWAGPIVAEVAPWDETDVAGLPANIRPYFIDRNIRRADFDVANKPANMARQAPGINPDRWES
ncbi:MAG: phytanoyl-CoA dioxygenase family protein [Ardenticatenaceae bacterium]|nr:phytanoyl-CoA dioxygenase family protein [Ardenticatenaceae bacterium]